MTPELAALWGVIAGGLITLIGTALTGALNIALQRRQTVWQQQSERRREVFNRRLTALQNCVEMIDFIIAMKGAKLGPAGADIWRRIREANTGNGAFFPDELQSDVAQMVRQALVMDAMEKGPEKFELETLERLRKGCVEALKRELEST